MPENNPPLVLVPIRRGSKGLTGKNIRPLAGKPLYRHSVDQALRIFGACVISTDIPEVINAELPAGCTVIERPVELAGDTTPMASVVMHALDVSGYSSGPTVLLQATSPLRSDDDVAQGMSLFHSESSDLVMSVSKADRKVLKWGMLENNRYVPLSRPKYCFENRQSLPPVFMPNGAVYIFSAEAFRGSGGFPTENICAFVMSAERSRDIDNLDEFEAAEKMLIADKK